MDRAVPLAAAIDLAPSDPAAASRQLVDLPLHRFLDDRFCGFVPASGATFGTYIYCNGNFTENATFDRPLVERDFLFFSDDSSAIADVADVSIVRVRHAPNLLLAPAYFRRNSIVPGVGAAAA
jgi:hypothetical protein